MPLVFEWDARKARANQRKHRVSFDEACTVFDDLLARIFPDGDHSNGEQREIIVGRSILDRLLLVSLRNGQEIDSELSVRGRRHGKNKGTMKKTSALESRTKRSAQSLRGEYRLDYAKAQPNRFAGRVRAKSVVVLLAPDVAKVFKTGESVNGALRAILKAVPRGRATTT
jgi:uncharacterized DUF497 family protein